MPERISPRQFHESEGVEGWRVIGDGACAYFRTESFAASARFVQAISRLPGVEDHKPDVDLRHDGATARLITCDSPGDDLVDPRGRGRGSGSSG